MRCADLIVCARVACAPSLRVEPVLTAGGVGSDPTQSASDHEPLYPTERLFR